MNENINLCEILKNCQINAKLWSPIWGEVYFDKIVSGNRIAVKVPYCPGQLILPNGKLHECNSAECILFPSQKQRDWSKFEASIKRFDPKTFKPFDKVLVRDLKEQEWFPTMFACLEYDDVRTIDGGGWKHCIPFNEETSHLANTADDCPEFYKWKVD